MVLEAETRQNWTLDTLALLSGAGTFDSNNSTTGTPPQPPLNTSLFFDTVESPVTSVVLDATSAPLLPNTSAFFQAAVSTVSTLATSLVYETLSSTQQPAADAGGSEFLGVNLSGMSTEEFLELLPIVKIYPLKNWDNSHVVVYALLYALVFLIGVCGNVSVITLIRHVHMIIPYDNTMIYVLFLCCVDLASIVPLPMAVVDQLLGFWMFGTGLCKVYRILEHVGRALSTFVLAAMAFDRFRKVCFPHSHQSRRSVVKCLIVMSLFTFALLSPLLINASSQEIVLKEVLLENPYRLARVRIYKCYDNLDERTQAIFVIYMFFIGFFIPVVLIVVFYCLMVRRLFLRSRSIPTSQLPVNRIAGYTIAISAFFVLCWSPYWIAILYNLYRNYSDAPEEDDHLQTTDQFIYIMYGIHALPYVNSSFNWLFYGLLNSQLMRRANTSKFTSYAKRPTFFDESRSIMPTAMPHEISKPNSVPNDIRAAAEMTPTTTASPTSYQTGPGSMTPSMTIEEDEGSVIVPMTTDSLL